jgi:DNA polymerase-3 subunit delta'
MAFAPPVALDYLRRAQAGGRLAHAYLLIGGVDDAFELARQIAALVVRAPAAKVLTHPDVHLVEPESKSRRIVVDQVRALENGLRLRAGTVGGRKVGIIREADRLQIQAANAFLKTLEEPPAESLLLLVSAQPESLPETILSRCIKVTLLAPAGAETAGNAEEIALRELLNRAGGEKAAAAPSIGASYLLLREFTQILGAVRARVQEENDTALAREETHYGQTTDGAWLSEREGYYKVLTEARYLAERSRLVGALGRWWGDALRVAAAEDRPEVKTILRKLGAIEALQENLERNIQEALALEVAFLEVFGA